MRDDKRKELDARFNANQKRLEDIGRWTHDDERKGMTQERAKEEIMRIHAEQRQIIMLKVADNRARGRTLNDGKHY